jgi:hypothetical protein
MRIGRHPHAFDLWTCHWLVRCASHRCMTLSRWSMWSLLMRQTCSCDRWMIAAPSAAPGRGDTHTQASRWFQLALSWRHNIAQSESSRIDKCVRLRKLHVAVVEIRSHRVKRPLCMRLPTSRSLPAVHSALDLHKSLCSVVSQGAFTLRASWRPNRTHWCIEA